MPGNLHHESIVVDMHADTLLDVLKGKRRLADQGKGGHVDLSRLRRGGVRVQFFACFIEPEYKPERALKQALRLLDAFYREEEANRSELQLATSVEEIQGIAAAGKIAAILSIEGGEALERDLGVLRIFYRLGVRSLCLTWNERNYLADGVAEGRAGGGLTRFGVEVVRELNRLGMLVDVSHLGERGFWDVLEVSTSPVIASHSNARALCDHPRNLTDQQIRALAAHGGVVGINFAPHFLAEDGNACLDAVVAHIEYLLELVGPDHVGLGSDFDGIEKTPRGLEDVRFLPELTEALLARGIDAETVQKVLGRNILRVMDQVFRPGT